MVRRPILYSALVLLAVAVPAQLVASKNGKGIGHLLAGTPIALAASKVMASLGVAPDAPKHQVLAGVAGGAGGIAPPAGDLGYLALGGAERVDHGHMLVAAEMPSAPAVSSASSGGAGAGASAPGVASGELGGRGFPSGGGLVDRSGMPGPVGVKLPKGQTPVQLIAPTSGHSESDPVVLSQLTPIYLASGVLSTPDSSAVTGAPTSNPALDNGSNAGGNGNGNAYGLDKGGNGANPDTGLDTTPVASLVPQIAAAASPLVVPVEMIKQLLAEDASGATSPVIAALAPVLLADEGVVPEPATLTLMLAGLMGLGAMVRRRRL